MSDIKVAAIVAMAKNRCIGQDNDLPWHIPEDLEFFKKVTLGKPIIMGRNTFDSIKKRLGKPLPGRTNIVLSRSRAENIDDITADNDGPYYCRSLETAIKVAKQIAEQKNLPEIIIGGGEQLYTMALPVTDLIYLTEIDTEIEGDAFFPKFTSKKWAETANEPRPGVEEKYPPYAFKVFTRKEKDPET